MYHLPDLKAYDETTIIKMTFFSWRRKESLIKQNRMRHKFKTNENKVSNRGVISVQ